MADFRRDEGVRIRDEFISPCLTASLQGDAGQLFKHGDFVLYIEVKDNEKETETITT